MNRFRPSILLALIALSLILLLAMEGIWLRQVYQEKAENLSETVDHILTRSVQAVQDSLVQAYIMGSNNWVVKPSEDGRGLDSTLHLNFGTIDLRGDSEQPSKSIFRTDSGSSIVIRASVGDSLESPDPVVEQRSVLSRIFTSKHAGNQDTNEVRGNLSIFIRGLETDSAPIQVKEIIEMRLDKDAELLELGMPFVVYEDADSINQLSSYWVSNRFRDVMSGETVTISLPANPRYILAEMWPELVFGGVLFLLIATAFGVIYLSFRKQRRLTQLKNDFISNITHELKTPITTVRVAIEALQNFDALANPQRTQEYLDISRQELDRLNLLVDRVLKMSLFEKDKMELRPEALDMHPLLSSILSTMQLQFQKYRAEVELQVEGEGFECTADRLHLTSVIVNLLDNALKYSPHRPQIEVWLKAHATEIQLDIRDHGLGIPKAYQEKVFDKFFRVPTGDRHDVKGHGLGLSYVAEVVRRHKGRIELQSEPGQGTTFSLFFPKPVMQAI